MGFMGEGGVLLNCDFDDYIFLVIFRRIGHKYRAPK